MNGINKHSVYLDSLRSEYSRISTAFDTTYTKLSIVLTTTVILFFDLYDRVFIEKMQIEFGAFWFTLVFCIYGYAILETIFILMADLKIKKPELSVFSMRWSSRKVIKDTEDTYNDCINSISQCLEERQLQCRYIYYAVCIGVIMHIMLMFEGR